MENEDLLTPAPISKRAFAFIVDFVLAFIIGTLLNSFVTGTYMFDALNGNNLQLQVDDIFPGRDSQKNTPKQLKVEVWYHSSTPQKEVFQEHWNIEFIDKELSE